MRTVVLLKSKSVLKLIKYCQNRTKRWGRKGWTLQYWLKIHNRAIPPHGAASCELKTKALVTLESVLARYLAKGAPLCPATERADSPNCEPNSASQWNKLWTVKATPPVSCVPLDGKCSLIPSPVQCSHGLLQGWTGDRFLLNGLKHRKWACALLRVCVGNLCVACF